jgi:heme/copper-type cytochrome/quinol oxidase subunit 3
MTSPFPANIWLIAAGWLSLAAAGLHVACIIGGGPWYRALGAGQAMARLAERGDWRPVLITAGIALVLAVWAAYAFAGAGIIRLLPLQRIALVAISAVLLLRGSVMFYPAAFRRPDLSEGFILWSSVIVFAFGVTFAVGTWRAWNSLSGEL